MIIIQKRRLISKSPFLFFCYAFRLLPAFNLDVKFFVFQRLIIPFQKGVCIEDLLYRNKASEGLSPPLILWEGFGGNRR